MKEILKMLVNLVMCISAISVIYIAYYLLRINSKIKEANIQLEEEKDDCKLQIGKLDRRIKKLEKENNNEKRDNSRKNQTGNKSIRRN